MKPPAAQPGNSGRGLVLVREIGDSVELANGPTGTTIEIAFRLPTAAATVDHRRACNHGEESADFSL